MDPAIQTQKEEILNALSHGVGLLLSIPAVFFLLSLARMRGSKWHFLSCSIYGVSLMTMYFCSTLYHGVGIFRNIDEKYRDFLKDLDHCAIYILIAGTYTPLTLINLVYNNLPSFVGIIKTTFHLNKKEDNEKKDGAVATKKKTPGVVKVGWIMFGVVWLMCVLGVGSKLILGAANIPEFISNGFYLVMGWVSIVGIKDLIQHLPKKSLKLLVFGGITYTSGVAFLVWETAPFNHAIWHLFVSAGTFFHYFCILESLVPSINIKKDLVEDNHSHNITSTTTTSTTTTTTTKTTVIRNRSSNNNTSTDIKDTTKVNNNQHNHPYYRDLHLISNDHSSVILEHFEYAEKHIRLDYFGSGRRRAFIVKYMNTLYRMFFGW